MKGKERIEREWFFMLNFSKKVSFHRETCTPREIQETAFLGTFYTFHRFQES